MCLIILFIKSIILSISTITSSFSLPYVVLSQKSPFMSFKRIISGFTDRFHKTSVLIRTRLLSIVTNLNLNLLIVFYFFR